MKVKKVKKGGGIMFQRKRRRRLNEIPEKPLGVKGSKEGNFSHVRCSPRAL